MQKIFLASGVLFAALAVILGAFGAHGLKKIATPETVAIYQTGVQYQVYHSLALILLSILMQRLPGTLTHYSGFMFLAGIFFFSGSLYIITSFQVMNKVLPTPVGIITPIGGLFFILGWLLLLIAVIRN